MNNFLPKLLLSLTLCSLLLAESVEEEQGDPYYGVPLGALHYSAEGTSAEVYAADEFSIIFNHFYHNPREQGCTGMMVGPPRMEDKDNVVQGHGILLTMAHAPAAARHKQKRAKRAAAFRRTGDGRGVHRQHPFLGYWPAEFDHLLMGPGPEMKTDQKQQKVSTQQQKESAAVGAVMNRVNLSNMSVNEQLIQGNKLVSDSDPPLSSPSAPAVFLPSPNATVSSTTATDSRTTIPAANSSSTSSPLKASSSNSSSPKLSTVPSSSPRLIPTSTSRTSSSSQSAPIIVLSNKKAKEGHQQLTADFAAGNKVAGSEGEVRRAPARQNVDAAGLDDWVKANELDEKGIPPSRTASRTTMITSATTTPLFWVIKDPREARRERLLQLRRKLDPNPEPPTTTTTSAPFSPLQSQFELRRVRDKLVTFSLTNGAKITQYKWIGLWNQCTKRHIPLVSLRDVDPPREEKIMPLSGWSHNVTSYRLHILNCNTILIPSFHYDSRNTTRNTYFFVGIGQFPEAVEQQVKANVVGTRSGEPLRSYKGEDVMLRLPRPYRTFDIDFISIFNVDEQKSFGHAIIPSLLVPPCSDDE
uniref:DM13 domain-containing protein n=1 Tax=Globodera rostochiensis TaxID=31243 RepID=A0A914HES3_GLORO